MKLYDPPELSQEASRGDPPFDAWPGKPIGRSQLMKAAGDSRDWFRYGHRLQAAEMAWAEFIDARSPPLGSWPTQALAVKAGPPHRPHSHPSRGIFLGYQPQERDVTAATSSPKGRAQLLREYMDLLGTAHDWPLPEQSAPRGPRFPPRRSGQGAAPHQGQVT